MYIYKGKGVLVLAAVVALLLVFVTPSFAQIQFSTGQLVRQVRGEGRTETVGDISLLAPGSGGTIAAGSSVTITYSSTISNLPSFANVIVNNAAVTNHACKDATEGPNGATPVVGCPDNVVFTPATNSVTLAYNTGANTTLVAGNQISITGIRVDVASLGSGTSTVTASLSGTSPSAGTNITFTNPNLQVAIVVAKSLTVKTNAASDNLLTCKADSQTFSIDVAETFPAALTTLAQEKALSSTPTPDQGSQVEIDISGIPAGFTITGIALAAAPATTAGFTASFNKTSFTGTAIKSGVASLIVTPLTTNTGATEKFRVLFTIETAGPVASGHAGDITATVHLVPINTAAVADFTGTVADDSAAIVSFADNTQGSGTVATIADCVTQLLFPWVVADFSGFNTGIAMANTTVDDQDNSLNGASPQSGACVYTAMPADGTTTPIQFTRPVAAGATDAFEAISELPKGFTGHMFAVCQFLNAHAFVFIANGNEAEGYLALIVPTGSRVKPGGESLEH